MPFVLCRVFNSSLCLQSDIQSGRWLISDQNFGGSGERLRDRIPRLLLSASVKDSSCGGAQHLKYQPRLKALLFLRQPYQL